MIKQFLCSICLIHQLSANRLLLQITHTNPQNPSPPNKVPIIQVTEPPPFYTRPPQPIVTKPQINHIEPVFPVVILPTVPPQPPQPAITEPQINRIEPAIVTLPTEPPQPPQPVATEPQINHIQPAIPIVTPIVTLPAVINTAPPPPPAQPQTPVATPPGGFVFGAFGQLCPIQQTATQCILITDSINDSGTGRVRCNSPSDCCMCNSIECGYIGETCQLLMFGPSAATGVQNIRAIGAVNGFGTYIMCNGVDSCKGAMLNSDYTTEIECIGVDACAGATMYINNPKRGFQLDCTGANSCGGLKIDITIDLPAAGCTAQTGIFDMGGVECSGAGACEGLEITISNYGCESVLIQDIDCVAMNACNNAIFNFIGAVEIQNCQCGPSCATAIGLEQCFSNVAEMICADPLSCMGQIQTITNAMNGFELICGNVQSCENANIRFDLLPSVKSGAITLWEGFIFGGLNSAKGATITINNNQGNNNVNGLPVVLTIELIECGADGSCEGCTFITGVNVIITEVICAVNACNGCTIDGIPCDTAQTGPQSQQPQINTPQINTPPQVIQPIQPPQPVLPGQPQFVPV